MNKDVVYIEPEDDITDIITKIEKSKEKIVALVPPKKAGVFRSIVNIKLIAKAGAAASKTVVLVTVDPSITKLAGATRLPVAKNLQSAPEIPTVEMPLGSETAGIEETIAGNEETGENNETSASKIADNKAETSNNEDTKNPKKDPSEDSKNTQDADDEDDDDGEEDDNEDDKDKDQKNKSKKDDEKKKSKKQKHHGLVGRVITHKKTTIFLSIFGVVAICFLVWAFVFAPKVDFTVSIETEAQNFSEAITASTNLQDESASDGKFYIEQISINVPQEVTFEATGTKNIGDKATGTVVIAAYFPITAGQSAIAAKKSFTINGLNFITTDDTSLSWSGDLNKLAEECDNYGDASLNTSGCEKIKRVSVTAEQGGSNYNIGKSSAWENSNVSVYSDAAMTGGTDHIITVVQQSDVEAAKSKITASSEEENKTSLYTKIGSSKLIIETSFNQTTSAAEVTPAVDTEVTEGTTPTVKVTTTASVFVLDKAKLEEFIKSKVTLENGQKIYEIQDMYVESFTQTATGYTARLKAHYYVGPNIKEANLTAKILGQGLGAATQQIKSINGVTSVEAKTSYPWVNTVPSDASKVTMTITIRDKSGNAITPEDEKDTEDEDTEESSDASTET